MQSDSRPVTSTLPRLKTGVPGLDDVVSGGFPAKTITLISGPPGSGKSILCYQFIYQGYLEKQKCLYMTLDKKIEGLLVQASELGIDFKPAIDSGLVKFLFLNINKKLIYETMVNEILSGNYDRVVLDSITPLSEMPIYINNPELANDVANVDSDELASGNVPVRRLHLHYIMNALETSQCTAVVTSELPAGSSNMSRDGLSEFLADGVVVLSVDPTMDRRKLAVLKMRSTKHSLRPHDMQIGPGGIRLL